MSEKTFKKSSETGIIAIEGEQIAFSITRSRKRKRTIAFKMENDASLSVLIPYRASIHSVTKILQKRSTWILREKAEREKAPPQNDFSDGAIFIYLGYSCRLTVTQGNHTSGFALRRATPDKQSCILSPHHLHVHVPDETLSPENLRQEVRLEILLWIKKRARVKLKKRLDFWAQKMGVSYKKLVVTDPERRWGSCSADNIIRLNWRLMMAPLPILDYVVAHELAHIKHKNHSPRFWGFVAQAMPDWQKRRKILRGLERRLVI